MRWLATVQRSRPRLAAMPDVMAVKAASLDKPALQANDEHLSVGCGLLYRRVA
jgi:hypothetical protein